MTESEVSPITRKLGATLRIHALASWVPESTRVFVDIGTNHAILPIVVAKADRAQRCIAIDRSALALKDAQRRLRRSHCLTRIEMRLGDGMSVLTPEEIDVICVAGIGPRSMVRILTGGLDLMRNRAVRLILNPLGSSKVVREFLADHGFDLLSDTVVNGRGREYEVLVAHR